MNRNMAYFKIGLRVFWRTEVRQPILVLMRATGRATGMIIMPAIWVIGMTILLIMSFMTLEGTFVGFWLFRAPLHTSWTIVWLCRGSAILWIIGLSFLLLRHIIRIGKGAAEKIDEEPI